MLRTNAQHPGLRSVSVIIAFIDCLEYMESSTVPLQFSTLLTNPVSFQNETHNLRPGILGDSAFRYTWFLG